jgi:molybdopterin/thiamine biosynthesis adenylyltransferase/molybdopterin synthase catalytic subunit/rhodanese-related sulfurtransferase
MSAFDISAEWVDTDRLRASMRHDGSGGFCTFEGWVRNSNEGRAVDGLEYEAYEELARAEGELILQEAIARYGVNDARCVHRTGSLRIGDLAVWVGVGAAHRDEAFRACRYIIDEIKHRLPIWKKEHYVEGDTAWVACAHVHREHEHDHVHHDRVGPPFVPDYSRQTRLKEVGEAGQARLSDARVLVIGAGGLGCPVLSYLAGAGVGTLGIVDGDRLDASNLHRQTMYSAADVGELKAELARRRIAELNPTVVMKVWTEPLHAGNVVEVFSQFDLVVECTDDMRSRYLSNDAAVLTGTPLILAAVYQYEGQMQVVSARPGAPCLRCLWSEEPAPGTAGSCVESGVLGPAPGVLGAMQAAEALKILLGLPRQSDDLLLLYNLLDHTSQRLPIDVASGCARQGGCLEVARRAMQKAQDAGDTSIAFERLAEALSAGYSLVDLREPGEIAAEPLGAPAHQIPAAQIVERVGEVAGERLLLVCASGRRSDHAARLLRERGQRNAHSLSGGLNGLKRAPQPVP